MLHFNISISFILYLVSIPVALLVLYKFFRHALKSPEPSGPAAIGRGTGALLLGDLLGSHLVTFVCNFSNLLFHSDVFQFIERLGIAAIFVLSAFAAGYIAARTVENTQSMNYKIMCAVGIVPHGLIGFILLSGGVINHLAFWSYVPLVITGGYLRSQQHAKPQRTSSADFCA